MKITLTKKSKHKGAKIIFVTKSGKSLDTKKLTTDEKSLINSAHKNELFSGAKKSSIMFHSENCLFVGLGDAKELTTESYRDAAANAYKKLKTEKIKSVYTELDALPKSEVTTAEATQGLTEGLHLASYTMHKFKTKKNEDNMSVNIQTTKVSVAEKKAFDEGEILADCVQFSRYLGDVPGNLMTPDHLAKETIKKAKGTKLKVTVWDKARIKKEKFGGLYGVNLGGGTDPRFIIMEYKGAAASKKPICFVGKGLTFDAGGISIKPSSGMHEMKYDMCGGANVIGTMMAIAKLKLKVNAVGYVPSTENMLGPMANKPGDILTARNGKTVEVLNTDAEGRLILMDALSYASEKKPAAIVDAATLTGAMVVALANIHTGVFTRDEKLLAKIQKAAGNSQEKVWPMPLEDQHVNDMKGVHADLQNISNHRGAGSSTAAGFLSEFVDKDIPWAHFDIAGTAWNTAERLSYTQPKSATGAIVRTFVELAKQF